MIRKLVKDWNNLPAGAGVTLDPAEQVMLVDADRLVHLEKEGHLERIAPPPAPGAWRPVVREIPDEVRTGTSGRTLRRTESLEVTPHQAVAAEMKEDMERDTKAVEKTEEP